MPETYRNGFSGSSIGRISGAPLLLLVVGGGGGREELMFKYCSRIDF